MENELDLTLRLGLPSPTVETHLSLNTLTTDQTPTGSDYVLIDVPAKRAQRNSLAFKNAVDANATLVRRCGCSGSCLAGRINEMRKCTNMNCNTINTPMWRKGPLGPKSLCNACGIKFRKEKAKRCNGTE
ncbi:hypothetical protein N665_1847s0008 [Sinapis alba]|nr:hypothetical protein N665_1847s0008 [Sinapis alba]